MAPPALAPSVPVVPTEESRSGKTFTAANKTVIKIHGEKRLTTVTPNNRSTSTKYTIADVSRPLLAVCEMVDHGKRVVFDPDGSYIHDIRSGLTEPINRVGNTFEFDTY